MSLPVCSILKLLRLSMQQVFSALLLMKTIDLLLLGNELHVHTFGCLSLASMVINIKISKATRTLTRLC